jgi:ABC-2 type transport system ATP-binding protein
VNEAVLRSVELTKHYPPMRKGVVGIKDLVDTFRKRRGKIKALNNVTFEVNKGEVFGLLGPNGAGKTTFCKIISDLVIPTSGNAYVLGHDVIKEHKKVVGNMICVFGGEIAMWGVFGWRMSVYRNLKFIANLWKVPGSEMEKRISFALEVLDLEDKRDEWYQKLSGGTQQKLYLALPLIIQSPMILLDEPTIRVDVMTRREIHEIIRDRLCREMGCSVLLTTHNMLEAERVCDRVAILSHGEIAEMAKPSEIYTRMGEANFEDAFIKAVGTIGGSHEGGRSGFGFGGGRGGGRRFR